MGNTKQEELGKKIVSIIGQSDLKTQMQVFDLINSEVTAVLEELERKARIYETVTRDSLVGYDSYQKRNVIPFEAIQSIKERYSE